MYSFSTSFWMVPVSWLPAMPWPAATSWYISSSVAAGALIVMDVETLSSGSPENRTRMSSTESIATPTLPTSPRASGSSESYPICVGRSNATLSPPVPALTSSWYRSLDSFAVPNPAYCRIVHGRPVYIVGYTPRVNGNPPGTPSACDRVEAVERLRAVDGLDRQARFAASRVAHATTSGKVLNTVKMVLSTFTWPQEAIA